VTRSIHEAARDVARGIAKTDAYWTSMRQRKKVESGGAAALGSSGHAASLARTHLLQQHRSNPVFGLWP
jgi:hypothetical protein